MPPLIVQVANRITTGRTVAKGTAATELVFVLPVFLLIVLGCINLGRAVQYDLVLTNAVRAGGHYAASHQFTSYTRPAWEAEVRSVVREALAPIMRADAGEFHIAIETEDAQQDTALPRITVEVRHEFPVKFPWPGLPRVVNLHRQLCVRQYR